MTLRYRRSIFCCVPGTCTRLVHFLIYRYWGMHNTADFRTGEFFQVPTVGFTTSEYTYGIALYLSYTIRVLRKIAYIQKFRGKIHPIRACSRLGGTTLRKTYSKLVPLSSFYHRVFSLPKHFCQTLRGKKSIDTEAQKLLRPVLESAAQGLSRAISCIMNQVHSKIPI
eukprot:SAG11_NODE_1009_length_6204_cov_54.921149_5_plen_168_part_00